MYHGDFRISNYTQSFFYSEGNLVGQKRKYLTEITKLGILQNLSGLGKKFAA